MKAWNEDPFVRPCRRFIERHTGHLLSGDPLAGEWLDSQAEALACEMADLAADRAAELAGELRRAAA